MDILATDNKVTSKTIIEKIEKNIDDACNNFYSNRKKFITDIRKDKENLKYTTHCFLLKQKLYGLRDDELIVFTVIKALK